MLKCLVEELCSDIIIRTRSEKLSNVIYCSLATDKAAVYPQHPWKPIDFEIKPRDFYQSAENQKEALAKVSQALRILEPEDWYLISPLEFVNNGGGLK